MRVCNHLSFVEFDQIAIATGKVMVQQILVYAAIIITGFYINR
jgi:hypothetical protein